MKKTYVFSLMLLITGMVSAQTVLPNGDLEQWTGTKPAGWDASNFVFGTMQLQTVFRDTVAVMSGSSCARIETKSFNVIIAQPTIPGILTLGTIVVDMTTFSGNVEGGIPFTGRPLSLKGYINAAPAAGDSTMVAVGFSKWNGTTRDTIGSGLAWFSSAHNEWVALDVPLTFYNAQTPDSMNIIISSSAIGNNVVVIGSKVWVDSLYLDYGNVLTEVTMGDAGFSVWADGDRTLHYALGAALESDAAVRIMDLRGALVHHAVLDAGTSQGEFRMHHLSAGVYLVNVTLHDGRRMSRKVILK